tara:strand:+ start:12676 stop:13086 length:411 start_codon:yes stop_codon:yes gene_type:complete
MLLNITDPAIMFSGISLLFLAYTNRYLALASVVRTLNNDLIQDEGRNRVRQIRNLHLRITLIKYMQAFGVLSFMFCVFAMLMLFWEKQMLGEDFFIASLVTMVLSLVFSLIEILMSGQSLKMELERTNISDDLWDK